MRRWLVWIVLGLAAVGALAVGARDTSPPPTDGQRAAAIARTVRCPNCPGQSAAESNVPAAVNLREDIARRVAAGQSDEEIRQAYAASYGQRILMNPPRSGLGALVWVLPVVAFVVAAAGLAVAFRRWGRDERPPPTDEDRLLVERARKGMA